MQYWFSVHSSTEASDVLFSAAADLCVFRGLAFSPRWPEIVSEAIEAARALGL